MVKYELSQEKLDVINKTRSNIFDWRGQFTPELIEYLLSVFSKPGDVVADPFSGSGTVLLESIRCGYDALGFEINPSAFYMSKFFEYCKLTLSKREELITELRELVGYNIKNMNSDKMVYTKDNDYRTAYVELLDFAKYCNSIIPNHLLPFVINVLFMCEKDKKMSLKASLVKNINSLKSLLFSLPKTNNKIEANWSDARCISEKYNEKIDIIITSPPYINVFNYHQNYRGIVECFNYNLLNVANSEIGSNRKNRQNRFKTVVQYAIDMGHVLQSCTSSLKTGGVMIWIVGRCSNVRKVPFYNSNIISDLVNIIPGLQLEQISQRQFGNRFGEKIIEDIIIVKKTSNVAFVPLSNTFEAIGIRHLEKALPYVEEKDKADIEVLINKHNTVIESPILNKL